MTVLEQLYNRKHKRGRSVVEHTFGILKQSFRELLKKSELQVTFFPDVVMACCYLYNLLLGQDPFEVQRFLKLLQIEGLENNEAEYEENVHLQEDNVQIPPLASEMCQALEQYLGRQHNYFD
jgi:hypothetical protein